MRPNLGHGGRFRYFSLDDFAPLRLPQPDMLNTLVPFYGRMFTLPVDVSVFRGRGVKR